MKITYGTKKILAILLCFIVMLNCISVWAFAADYSACEADGCGGTYENGFCSVNAEHYQSAPLVNDVYQIANAGQLYWFAALVNSGTGEGSSGDNGDVYNAMLMQGIVVNAKVLDADRNLVADTENLRIWTPIGYYYTSSKQIRYSGTFEGNGFTVSGLYYNDEDMTNVGLIGYMDSGATVENVGVVESYIRAKQSVGGVVGSNEGGTVIGCWNVSSINGTSDNDSNRIGGVVGENAMGTVTECYNIGAVSGHTYVGGVVGYHSGNLSRSYNVGSVAAAGSGAGGVVGHSLYVSASKATTVKDCYNAGTVVGADSVGGVVGYNWGVNNVITGCYYLSGGAKDANDTVQNGIGSEVPGAAVSDTAGTKAATAEQFASGEVAYKMNGSAAAGESVVWYQNLDKKDAEPDTSPVLSPAHGTVYAGYVNCTESGYTNRENCDVPGDHVDENRDQKCDLCSEKVEAQPEETKPQETKPEETKPEETKPEETKPEETKPQVPECEKDDNCVLSQFADIIVNDWYHDGIHFCVENKIMNGMGEGKFAPNEPTTRAQLVTMLYRLEGEPSIEGKTEPFADVAETDWFYAPIVWAYNNKVVNGVSDTEFAPNANVTREQVATILYRFLGSPEGEGKLDEFPDVTKVSGYAKDALVWAVGAKLITGVAQPDGTTLLDPAGNATRAQIATILMRHLTA